MTNLVGLAGDNTRMKTGLWNDLGTRKGTGGRTGQKVENAASERGEQANTELGRKILEDAEFKWVLRTLIDNRMEMQLSAFRSFRLF